MSQKRGNMIENIIVGVIVALVIIAGVVAWWFENHGEDIQNPDRCMTASISPVLYPMAIQLA